MSHNEIKFNDDEPTLSSSFSAYSLEEIVIGRSESDNLSNSGFVGFGAGNNIYFYDTNPINTISGATLSGANDWYYQISLPAGS